MNDWYDDGRIEGSDSCAAVVVAAAHLSVDPPAYSDIVDVVNRYGARVCTHHPDFAAVKIGMANSDVAALGGWPQSVGPSCWLYRFRASRKQLLGSRSDGMRICFTRGRVSVLQGVQHGSPSA